MQSDRTQLVKAGEAEVVAYWPLMHMYLAMWQWNSNHNVQGDWCIKTPVFQVRCAGSLSASYMYHVLFEEVWYKPTLLNMVDSNNYKFSCMGVYTVHRQGKVQHIVGLPPYLDMWALLEPALGGLFSNLQAPYGLPSTNKLSSWFVSIFLPWAYDSTIFTR